MLESAVAIVGIIFRAVVLLRILRHYLNSRDSHTHKPQSQEKNHNEDGCIEQEVMMFDLDGNHNEDGCTEQEVMMLDSDGNHNEDGCTEQEVMMFDSNGTDVQLCCIWDDLCTFFKAFYEFHRYEVKCMFKSFKAFYKFHIYEVKYKLGWRPVLVMQFQGGSFNSNPFDASERRWRVLENVMESLADPNTHLIGVYGFYDEIKDTLVQRVSRRVQRDQLFGIVVTATITRSHDVKKIQDDIARQLGFTLTNKSKDKRAKELIDRIKNEQSILIVLHDLYKELDLSKIGIPYSVDHMRCKILLTSAAEHVLADHMHTQKNFLV